MGAFMQTHQSLKMAIIPIMTEELYAISYLSLVTTKKMKVFLHCII